MTTRTRAGGPAPKRQQPGDPRPDGTPRGEENRKNGKTVELPAPARPERTPDPERKAPSSGTTPPIPRPRR